MRLFKLRTNYWPQMHGHLPHCSSNWTHWHKPTVFTLSSTASCGKEYYVGYQNYPYIPNSSPFKFYYEACPVYDV